MYKIRKGVLLEQICGVYLLITSDEARPPCPYFREVNETIAFYFSISILLNGLSKNYNTESTTYVVQGMREYDAFYLLWQFAHA